MQPERHSVRRPGFTLIELLTVVGIIALLIGILLPSLIRVRVLTKKAKTAKLLTNIETALQMFHNDFDDYPRTSKGGDPISNWPEGLVHSGSGLEGPQWLARALVGHDCQGIDVNGHVLADSNVITADYEALRSTARNSPYLNPKVVVRDDEPRFEHQDGFAGCGYPVIIDAFDGPVLYYRANRQAHWPFSLDGQGDNPPDARQGQLGIYNQADNLSITGFVGSGGWDFAGTGRAQNGPVHPIGTFGSIDPAHVDDPPEQGPGRSFTGFLHDRRALGSGVVRPYNPDTYLLISAGNDAIYGTSDDVANFPVSR